MIVLLFFICDDLLDNRAELAARGRVFESETDTEVVAHLVSERVEAGAEAGAVMRPPLACGGRSGSGLSYRRFGQICARLARGFAAVPTRDLLKLLYINSLT